MKKIIDKLYETGKADFSELYGIISEADSRLRNYAAAKAADKCNKTYW